MNRLNDYTHHSLQSLTFPTLFPFGRGNVTSRDRIYPVSLADSNWHLLKYYYFDSLSDCFVYPFALHERWIHWRQKTAEQHRLNGQKNVYTQHHPEDANLTEEELTKMLDEGGEDLRKLVTQM